MTLCKLLKAALMGGLVAFPALADDKRPLSPNAPVTVRAAPRVLTQLVLMDCVVQGTPTEFPNDLVIRSLGPAEIPAGYKVAWEAPANAPMKSGTYTFTAPLPPQGHVSVLNAFPGGLEAWHQCSVTAIK